MGALRQLLRADAKRVKVLAHVERRLAEDPRTPPSVLRVVRELLTEREEGRPAGAVSKVKLLGVAVRREDAQALIVKLLGGGAPPAYQAAKTISQGLETGAPTPALSGAERDAILAALQDAPPGLSTLRRALILECRRRHES
jgi:hypothetical protein